MGQLDEEGSSTAGSGPSSTTTSMPHAAINSAVSSWVLVLTSVIGVIASRLWKQLHRRRVVTRKSHSKHRLSACSIRKDDFLCRHGDNYGYRTSPCGFIDDWRAKELSGLIPPNIDGSSESSEEGEVYLDYAGSALPTQSQLHAVQQHQFIQILANPHSTGPAAARTTLCIEQVKTRLLTLLDAHPGRYAAFGKHAPHTRENNGGGSSSLVEWHPGYEIVFTSGTTEALRIVAERFPFSSSADCCPKKKKKCGNSSVLVYPQNSHTSVVGMRGPVLARGGKFVCKPMADLCKDVQSNNVASWISDQSCSETAQCQCCKRHHHLVVLPLECNFAGARWDCQTFLSHVKRQSCDKNQFCTVLDIAKAAATSKISLKQLDPDFAALSFYKVFGEPTGLGCLLVKRSAIDILCRPDNETGFYFGGGSVDAVLATTPFVVPRSEPSPLARLSNGTIHFRGIVALQAGLSELERLGGMEAIERHVRTLGTELVHRFQQLTHGKSGKPVIRLYGAWNGYLAGRDAMCPGPTVTFNIVRDDNSFVGYNEVSKLAALNRPPIQFRTGCFCNPGACQLELGLSNDDILRNYQEAGHVCGDHVDIVNGRPTGAIRVSFGKDSVWEDLDALVTFVERLFVCPAERMEPEVTRWNASPCYSVLSELYLFPIKSCAAQRVKRWQLLPNGRLAFDREFALVDASGAALRLQNYPQMAFLRPTLDVEAGSLTVSAPGRADMVISICSDDDSNFSEAGVVKVCGAKCGGSLWGDHAVSDWLSEFLGVRCWLARYVKNRYELPTTATRHGEMSRSTAVAFANEQPLLLISENAVDTLNTVLRSRNQPEVSSRHFRPNMVVQLSGPKRSIRDNLEDGWTDLRFTQRTIKLEVVGPCPRCSMVDVDPLSGMKGKTLRALSEYRRNNGQINFGVFLRGAPQLPIDEALWVEEGDTIYCK